MSVSYTVDSEATGNFEVFVGQQLAHSKAAGDGYVDSPGKIKAIKRAIRDATSVQALGSVTVAPPGGLDVEVSTAAVVVRNGDILGADNGANCGNGDSDCDDEGIEESNASLVVSMLTLVLSIPALIGA